MKKYISLMSAILLVVALLTGCMGKPVVIENCTCPSENNTDSPTTEIPVTKGSVKTGLAVVTTGKGSSATTDEAGKVELDTIVVAVTVDDNGVINSCVIDNVPATVTMDINGAITSDISAPVLTKAELGADYGMVAYGNAIAEWDAQVAALEGFVTGKTVAELKTGAIDETGKAPEGSDLASSATIYLGGFISAIERAVNNAQHLGADAKDRLHLATLNKLSSTDEKVGYVQLDADVVAVTVSGETITSCVIDSVQAKVEFDHTGAITTDLSLEFPSKNELGEAYGMVAWGGAMADWNVQAASFAAYVTGKTAAQVAGIAVNEATKPADGTDLSSSVTISIGGFQALIAKALAQ